jgi:uncharacterized integral membrane protein|tara:strand:+ start:7434 stop:7733 length:300 start_codon:yes stop_codon:yes gene_type:complete
MKEYWNDLTSGEKTKLILKIILGILVLIFAIRNWQSTPVKMVFFEMNLPLTIIIVLCLGIGFALASVFDYRKFKIKNKEITDLKSKIANLTAPKTTEEN